MGMIYCARNVINGKCYIGKTAYDIKYRKGRHESAARGGATLPFARALRKYGFASFTWSVLFQSNVSDEFLSLVEIDFIADLGTQVPSGYNVAKGGGGGVLGWKHTEQTRIKLSAFQRSRGPVSAETRERMRISGRSKKFTVEHRKALSEAQRIAQNQPSTKQRMSELVKERYTDPAFIEKMARIQADAEYRKQMSQSVTIAHNLPEFKKKMSEKLKERWKDPDARQKMLEALQKTRSTPEYKAKLLAQRRTPEYRAKMSAAKRKQKK